jgi:hypothetical protein
VLVLTWGPAGEPLAAPTTANASLLAMTGTTARLAGPDHVMTAVAYAQTIYAAAQDKDRPGAVILVRDDDPAVAVAVTRLQHFPVNAPLLFLADEGRTIPEATKAELERLDPEGVMMDHNVQVYVAGNISEVVAREVEDLDFIVRRIAAPDPVAFTGALDDYLAVLDSNHQEVVLVGSLDALPFMYAGSNWNAHMGRGFAFVTREGVPDETRRILTGNWPDTTYIYVFAPPSEVNASVMAELAEYGHVQRIPGETPQEMAVRWAGYKDSGREEDWWFGFDTRSVGWGYAEPGHNVILANPSDWRTTVPTGVLSHMGKHAFLLLTDENGGLPEATRDYLGVLRPTRTHPSEQVYNFGWITGPGVPDATMRELSDLLEVANDPAGRGDVEKPIEGS